MGDHGQRRGPPAQPNLADEVGAKAARKLLAQERPPRVWSGLGLAGMVGWAVVAPTLAGAAIGAWLDGSRPGAFSWTLSLMLAGLVVGCMNAWYWVAKEVSATGDGEGDQHA